MKHQMADISARMRSNDPVLLLFDCDGTLVDSAGVIVEVMRRAFVAGGLEPVSDQAVRNIIGLTLNYAIGQLADLDPLGDQVAALTQSYKELFIAYRQEPDFAEPMFDGVSGLLEQLQALPNVICGVVTGKSRRGLSVVSAQHGFEWMASLSRTADDCLSKPHPAMVLECCAAAGIDAAHTLVVGDTTFDMEMATAAGAIPIGVDWGYHTRVQLNESKAFTVIDKPLEIISLLDMEFSHA